MDRKELTGILIEDCEGFEPVAKKDKWGVVNIGCGLKNHYLDGTAICEGDVCTKEEALDWVQQFCEKNVYPRLYNWIENFNVTDRMYASLCAFVYNVGVLGISLISALRHDDMNELKEGFLKYDKVKNANGEYEFCQGLKNRRQKEIDFFLNEDGSLK